MNRINKLYKLKRISSTETDFGIIHLTPLITRVIRIFERPSLAENRLRRRVERRERAVEEKLGKVHRLETERENGFLRCVVG